MLNVQVLIATMDQTDHNLLEKMNIQSDAIVGNQCDRNEIEEFEYKGNNIKWLSFAERGVGLNRNNALMRATAEFCVLADDDMRFHDGYLEKVQKAFEENPNADVIVYNIDENPVVRFVNSKKIKVSKHNYGRYGAVRIAFRREKIFLNNISFNLLFGGGAKYSAGEDSLFLKSCLDKGLKIIAVPFSIARLEDARESTWFRGHTDKFFLDKGVLYYCLSRKASKLLSFYHCFKHRKKYADYGWKNAYKMMRKGIKNVK